MWCVISDLDGTLLTGKQEISNETYDCITSYIEKGGYFTFATGRSLQSALPFIKQLNIQLPVILYNGARIYHPITKQYIYQQSIEAEKVQQVMDLYNELKKVKEVSMLAFDQNGAYYLDINPYIERQVKKDGILAEKVTEQQIMRKEIIKLLFIDDPETIQFYLSFFHSFNTVNSEPELLEILPYNANKGIACEFLINYLQLSIDQLVTVGDNCNDVEMIRLAKYGVAVNNANLYVKKIAKHVTTQTNEENAIGELLNWLPKKINI